MPPLKTSRTQLICRACSATFWTQVRGRSTKCPHCKAGRYVPLNPEWEGPVTAKTQRDYDKAAQVAERLPVWCTCSCGHQWQSRAADGQRLRCVECKNGVRIPVRTHENTQALPPGSAPAPRPRAVQEVQPRRSTRAVPAPAAWKPQTLPKPVPVPAPAPVLGGFLASLGQRAVANTAPAVAPRSAPAPAVARPAFRKSPHEVEKERRRQESIGPLLKSLPGPFYVWWERTPGLCEVLDSNQDRERQKCPATAVKAVVFQVVPATETVAYTCARHAPMLKSMADNTPNISASIHPIRQGTGS